MTASRRTAGLAIDAARRALAARFAAAKIGNPELDARLLIGAAANLDLTQLIADGKRSLGVAEAEAVERFAARRIAGEPIARILGEQEFWGLRLTLSDATLIPRADTETIVETALVLLRSMPASAGRYRIADLGTGSGAILLALLTELLDATGVGTDLSEEALQTAQINAELHGLADRIAFIVSDYASALNGPFDLVVSNPPYIRSADIDALAIDVRDHDPHLALDGGADGLGAYRIIAAQAPGILKPGGALVVEVGIGQATDVALIMAASGLVPETIPRPDLAGIPRAVAAWKPSV